MQNYSFYLLTQIKATYTHFKRIYYFTFCCVNSIIFLFILCWSREKCWQIFKFELNFTSLFAFLFKVIWTVLSQTWFRSLLTTGKCLRLQYFTFLISRDWYLTNLEDQAHNVCFTAPDPVSATVVFEVGVARYSAVSVLYKVYKMG